MTIHNITVHEIVGWHAKLKRFNGKTQRWESLGGKVKAVETDKLGDLYIIFEDDPKNVRHHFDLLDEVGIPLEDGRVAIAKWHHAS